MTSPMGRKELFERICRELADVYPPDEARAAAWALIEEMSGIGRTEIFLDPRAEIVPPPAFFEALEQLRAHRPLQYVLGTAEFYGLTLRLDERVLIPRPETEELVRRIVGENRGASPRILDVGTGSGAIALALARELPGAAVTGLDISPGALELARENARTNGVEVNFQSLDILTQVPEGQYDLIVSNPPYVRVCERSAMRRNVLDYEPEAALFVPDDDPLLFYRRIASLGRRLLVPGGALWFEINEAFGRETAELLAGMGYEDMALWRDLFGKERMVRAKNPSGQRGK